MSKLDFIAHICELSKRPIDAEGVFTTAVFDLRTTLTVRVALRCRLPRYSLPPVAWPRCRCVDAEQISISRWSPKLTSISCCRRRPPLMTTVPLRPNSWLYSASTEYWTTSLVTVLCEYWLLNNLSSVDCTLRVLSTEQPLLWLYSASTDYWTTSLVTVLCEYWVLNNLSCDCTLRVLTTEQPLLWLYSASTEYWTTSLQLTVLCEYWVLNNVSCGFNFNFY